MLHTEDTKQKLHQTLLLAFQTAANDILEVAQPKHLHVVTSCGPSTFQESTPSLHQCKAVLLVLLLLKTGPQRHRQDTTSSGSQTSWNM